MKRDHRRLIRTVPAAAVVTGALALGAFYASGDDGNSRTASPTVTTEVESGPLIDWAAHSSVDLGDGWTVVDTEGAAPLVTVLRDGRIAGYIDYLDYTLETGTGDTRAALDYHVARFFRDIGADRADGPIKGYRFVPDEAVHATASDGANVRYGFRGTLPDGSPSERTIQWAGIRDGHLVLVSAAANDPGGLFSPEAKEFTSAELDTVADRLDRMVRASGLPHPQPSL